MMPAFSATRETLNASVRCSIVVTSAMIALLAVMNCAQPKAASKAMSATMSGEVARQAEADVERHAADDGDDEDGAAPDPVAQGAADHLHRQGHEQGDADDRPERRHRDAELAVDVQRLVGVAHLDADQIDERAGGEQPELPRQGLEIGDHAMDGCGHRTSPSGRRVPAYAIRLVHGFRAGARGKAPATTTRLEERSMSSEQARTVERVITPQSVIEGAGVRLQAQHRHPDAGLRRSVPAVRPLRLGRSRRLPGRVPLAPAPRHRDGDVHAGRRGRPPRQHRQRRARSAPATSSG